MKKAIVVALVMTMVAGCLTACGSKKGTDAKGEGVMTYEEYVAAPLDSEVTIETYVQANQSWWDNTITLYTQDKEGGYFIYNLACSEEDAKKLTKGTKIKVNGYKSEWSGEVEVTDGTFEIEDGTYTAEAVDITKAYGTDDLTNYQNQYICLKGMTVEAANEEGDAFLYNWDGSGEEGSDLYFNLSLDGNTYSFTVESYLCDSSTDVYQAVKNLNVGDTVDVEGFLYWYEGPQPHVTGITVK